MSLRPSSFWIKLPLIAFVVVSFATARDVVAQEQPAAEDTPVAEAEGEAEQVDPYQVPDGTVDELFEYLQTGRQRMQPRTREDAVRMFQSLDQAAEQIYTSTDANVEQREQAARWRVACHRQLEALGSPEAREQLQALLNQAANDPEPEIQQFAKSALFDLKIGSWSRLSETEREAVLDEIRAGTSGDNPDPSSVLALMKLADSVAETPDAARIATVIDKVVQDLGQVDNPEIAKRLPRLEGLVRRLNLPGNKMEIEGTLLSGEPVDWEAYRGKVVLVDYWATWCGPCIAELPNVLKAYEAYHGKGFDVLGISLDNSKDSEAVENFLQAKNVPWQTLFSADPENDGWNHPMAQRYAINGIPRAILVDQDGRAVSMNLRGPALEEALSELLGPPEPPVDSATSAEPDDAKTVSVAP